MTGLIPVRNEDNLSEMNIKCNASPPFLYPCFYGTDVTSSGQLIAAEHSTDEVRKELGADTLAYLRIEDFKAMTGNLPLCTACFSGHYPL